MSSQSLLIISQFTLVALVLFAVSVGFAAFEPMHPCAKRRYLAISLGLLCVMTMFHSVSVGNDTPDYVTIFLSAARYANPGELIASSSYEPGYLLWNWLISRVSDNPQMLFVASGLVTYLSIGRFMDRWVSAPGVVVCALVSMRLFDGYLSAMRQTMAFAVLLFAYDLARSRRPMGFFALVVLAAQFHTAALFFLSVYPLVNLRFDASDLRTRLVLAFALLGAVAAAMLLFDRALAALLSVFPKYQSYLGGSYVDGQPRLATVLNIAVYLLMIVVPRALAKDSEASGNDASLQRLAALNVIVLLVSLNATILTRFTDLLALPALCSFASAAQGLRSEELTFLTYASVALMYLYGLTIAVLKTPEWYSTYPFSFCWSLS